MSLDALCRQLPAYAKDLSANLACLCDEAVLTDQQKWGAFVAAAHAVGERTVVALVDRAAAQAGLTAQAADAAKAAAAIMAMNNVYYRSLHLLSNSEYRTMPARMRMNVIANPGVDKLDFELWCTAVSAIHGCGMCLDSHEGELRKHRVAPQRIQAALRIAAVVSAVSQVIAAEGAHAPDAAPEASAEAA